MAQLLSNFTFTGKLGNISAYKMKGSDKIILRTRGGATKEKIKRAPEFEITRRINAEFGGRSGAVKALNRVLEPVKPLADYNIAGPLNALIKPIQGMDTESEYGKRNICFTKNPKLLEGFNLNQRNPFDSIIRNTFLYTLSKENLSAEVNIPALIPGINFKMPPGGYPLYSFIIVLGMVPDIIFDNGFYKPATEGQGFYITKETGWSPVLKSSPAISLEINFQNVKLTLPTSFSSLSVMLAVGIRFGTVSADDKVLQVKNAGAAKILAMQ